VTIHLAVVTVFALTLLRVAGVFVFFPGLQQIPPLVGVGAAAAVAWGVMPQGAVHLPATSLGLAADAALNLCVGAALSYGARVLYSAAMLAGEVTGIVSGVSAAEAVSPLALPVPVVGNLFSLGTLALFFGSGAAGLMVVSIARSFAVWPLAGLRLAVPGPAVVVTWMVQSLTVALGIAAPLVAVQFVILAAMGLIGRAMPQMNLLLTGIPLQLLLFAILLAVAAGPLAGAMGGIVNLAIQAMGR